MLIESPYIKNAIRYWSDSTQRCMKQSRFEKKDNPHLYAPAHETVPFWKRSTFDSVVKLFHRHRKWCGYKWNQIRYKRACFLTPSWPMIYKRSWRFNVEISLSDIHRSCLVIHVLCPKKTWSLFLLNTSARVVEIYWGIRCRPAVDIDTASLV